MLVDDDLLAASLVAMREGQAARSAVAQLAAQSREALALVESVAREALQLGRTAGEEAAKGQDAAADAHAAADRDFARALAALTHLRGEVNDTILALAAAARDSDAGHARRLQDLAGELAHEIRRVDPLVAAVAQIQQDLPATAGDTAAAREVADQALRLADQTAKRLTLQRPTSRISHQWRGSNLQLRNADGTFGRAVDLRGPAGERGPRGPAGPMGPMPKHRWNGTALAFEVTPGEWGAFVDLRGPRGSRGTGGGISSRGLSGAQVLAMIEEYTVADDTEHEHHSFSVSQTGPTDVLTPAAGKRIRIVSVAALSDPDAADAPDISVFLGGDELFRGYAIQRKQRKTGPVDGAVSIGLSNAAAVSGTIVYDEVDA